MSKAKVIFHECIQNEQELCVPDEMMVSRVYFTLEVEDKKYEGLSATLKQTVGSNYKLGLIEVGRPEGYDGVFNHDEFRKCATNYYIDLIGSHGTGIRVEGGRNIVMYNNRFKKEMICEFEI